MSEKTIEVFIDGVTRYFEHTSDKDVIIGTPYLVENKQPAAHDYTGIISITGPLRGCVYFTAPTILVKHLLMSIGEPDTSEDNILDLVGEVANTVAGNARREFGSEFVISVPVVISGQPSGIHLPAELRSYVIPITWKSYKAAVCVCLQS